MSLQSIKNKKIIIGINGGIAAYKLPQLVRNLCKMGAQVRIVMTASAHKFVTPLTLQALSGHRVYTEFLCPETEVGMEHIELAKWADWILIAPATANFIAHLAGGASHDLLSTLCLATSAPIFLAPAMNQGMWSNPATQHNIQVLKKRGITLLGPDEGIQACGDTGPGRMLEPEIIIHALINTLTPRTLTQKNVLITAGPTHEMIDPVRYMTNNSSGKMGYAMADAAADAGANVILVSGPTTLTTTHHMHRVDVLSALSMHICVMQIIEAWQPDIFISSAAVSDYRPIQYTPNKIKKEVHNSKIWVLECVQNPDIIANVAQHCIHRPHVVVGFAAESEHLILHAHQKIKTKNLDMIIANDISQSHIGFHSDDNAVTVLEGNNTLHFPKTSKRKLALQLIHLIAQKMPA